MFEKFPQLKRLERLLSKAQAFSPRKQKNTERSLNEDSSPIPTTPQEFTKPAKSNYIDTFDSFADDCYKQPVAKSTEAQGKNLYDSDDLLDFKTTEARRSDGNKTVTHERKRTWTTIVGSLPEPALPGKPVVVTLNNRGSSKRMSKKPMDARIAKLPGKQSFMRQMLEAPLSDALNVLSDEESEEGVTERSQKRLRYPLPTMPLEIMVPVNTLPDCIVPTDFNTVLSKISRFDNEIGSLMDARNRIARSYTVFDELCTSFSGQKNLDYFLRSLVPPQSPSESARLQKRESSSVPKQRRVANRQDKAKVELSMPPTRCRSSAGSSASSSSTGSRLLRPTASSKMKQVDNANNRPKYVSFHSESVDCSVSSYQRSRSAKEQTCKDATRQIKKETTIARVSPKTHVSEKDARDDMMQRVRRGIMGLKWIGKSRKNLSEE